MIKDTLLGTTADQIIPDDIEEEPEIADDYSAEDAINHVYARAEDAVHILQTLVYEDRISKLTYDKIYFQIIQMQTGANQLYALYISDDEIEAVP